MILTETNGDDWTRWRIDRDRLRRSRAEPESSWRVLKAATAQWLRDRLHVTPGTVSSGAVGLSRIGWLASTMSRDRVPSGTITDEQVEQLIIPKLETTPPGATHWSTREMAKAVGLSHTAISHM